jgi:hypothetical protein
VSPWEDAGLQTARDKSLASRTTCSALRNSLRCLAKRIAFGLIFHATIFVDLSFGCLLNTADCNQNYKNKQNPSHYFLLSIEWSYLFFLVVENPTPGHAS